jgi:DUF1365 family protein
MGRDLNGQAPAAGVLYPARISHRRRVAPYYRFVYRVFYLLLDVDRIDALASQLRWFSHNRFNLLSFHDRDHAGGGAGSLRAWAEGLLAGDGVALDGGRIRLLCLPRLFGFAFNPISLWYCEHRDGSLRAVIVEVRNTFGEKHAYLIASGGKPLAYDEPQEKEKCFHVSPFFDLVGRYRFRFSEPGERLRLVIHETREGIPILDATLAAERKTLSDRAILAAALAMPWMTVKVVAGIHWEASKIWLRGARFHRKPAPPGVEVT